MVGGRNVDSVHVETVQAHTRAVEDIIRDENINVSIKTGLQTHEVTERLGRYGPNELTGSGQAHFLKMLLRNIFNAMNFVLAAAVVLSAVAGDVVEAVVVGVIIIANTSISVAQEYSSEKTLDALRRMSSPIAHVIRNGEEMDVPAVQVVLGDIVVLREGDQIPADIRLFEAVNLGVDEAMLTGESLPVRKNTKILPDADVPLGDRLCMGFKNTVVMVGRGRGVVVATGMNTEIGKIAASIASSEGKSTTALERQMNFLMLWLLVGAIILALIVFAVSSFNLTTEVLLYALSLAVAMIPEALPAVLTITFSVAIRTLARERAVVRRMNALESLGCVTDICSDKTGTLTLGQMTATVFWTTLGEVDLRDAKGTPKFGETSHAGLANLLLGCTLNNTASVIEKDGEPFLTGDPTETALLSAGIDSGLNKDELQATTHKYETEFSFEATLKRMTVISRIERDGEELRLLSGKGAAEVVLERCSRIVDADGRVVEMTPDVLESVLKVTRDYADQALRVLAFAYREDKDVMTPITIDDRAAMESDWIFCGLVGLEDPPRPESAPAVEKCMHAGIVVHMVTGDHPRTAAAIARRIGILQEGGVVLEAREFDAMTEEEIDAMPELPHVIARCAPETKVKLIQALHRRDRIAAMTGDGVNDAPAVKHADVGIAMGHGGTDVTKQAADVVLTDDNFATIVRAVSEGRRIVANIGKFTLHLLSGNVSQVIVLVVGLGLVGQSGDIVFPMSALQILWMNLITSSGPAICLGLEKSMRGIMERPPRSTKRVVFSNEVIIDTFAYGVIMGAIVLSTFVIVIAALPTGSFDATGCNHSMTPPGCDAVYRARAAAFTTHCILLLLHAYNCRDINKSIFKMHFNDNRSLFYVVVCSILALFPVVYIPYINTELFRQAPISWEWGMVVGFSILFVALSELYKLAKGGIRRRFRLYNSEVPDEAHLDAKALDDEHEEMELSRVHSRELNIMLTV